MCDAVVGDTPAQALHRAVDQLTEVEKNTTSDGRLMAPYIKEQLARAEHIRTLAQRAVDHFDGQRQLILADLLGPNERIVSGKAERPNPEVQGAC